MKNKPTRNDRIVISNAPDELHEAINKWCLKHGTKRKPASRVFWAKEAMKSLLGK